MDMLAFGAHPDDVDVTVGGILCKMADMGYSTGIIDMTMGEMGTYGSVEERQQEIKESAKILGLSLRENLRLPDCNLVNDFESRLKVIKALREHRPRVVLAPHWDAFHPDQGVASTLIQEAVFYSGLKNIDTGQEPFRPEAIYFYIAKWGFRPTFVVDITEQHERKIKSLKAFRTQYDNPQRARGEATYGSPEFFERAIYMLDGYYGYFIGVKYGEALLAKDVMKLEDPCLLSRTYHYG